MVYSSKKAVLDSGGGCTFLESVRQKKANGFPPGTAKDASRGDVRGCFYRLGVLFAGVLIIRAMLCYFGVQSGAPEFRTPPCMMWFFLHRFLTLSAFPTK